MQDTLQAPLAASAALLSAPLITPHFPREQRWQAREAALVLDSEGRITDVNPAAAALLGYTSTSALEGMPVNRLIPDLPLLVSTPGYNLAYAAFHAGESDWLAHTAVSEQGLFIPIELALACVRVHGMRVIALTLRPASGVVRLLA